MSLNIYNVRKWFLMFTGKSVLHVNQDLGKSFQKDVLKGYYNNLTQKVLMLPELLDREGLPVYKIPNGTSVQFPVAIFQYGLGAYDLWLQTHQDKYRKKFEECCQWALSHQEPSGAWNNFFFKYPSAPYGAMAQGEACSLLLRGYAENKDERYFQSAHRAIDFMLKPLTEGGTTQYMGDNVILCEYTHLPVVMNGWIFAWWGLYDWVLLNQDYGKYQEILNKSEIALSRYLKSFTTNYWSLYDLSGKMASPFYHNLHIAQMQAMYQLTGNVLYKEYAERWQRNANSRFNAYRAIIKKAGQKILEKEEWTKNEK